MTTCTHLLQPRKMSQQNTSHMINMFSQLLMVLVVMLKLAYTSLRFVDQRIKDN